MGSEVEHIAIANRFQRALNHNLENLSDCSEWVATIAFYKSLHIVEAIFSTDAGIIGTPNHTKRQEVLKRHPRFKILFPSYSILWNASNVARYAHDKSENRSYSQFSDYFPTNDLRTNLLNRFLFKFEADAKRFLSNPDSLETYQVVKSEKAA